MGRPDAASAALNRAWRLHQAPRLIRFALRLAPNDFAAGFLDAQLGLIPDLAAVLHAAADDRRPVRWTCPPPLTPSEVEVLRLLRLGLTNAEIAAERHVVVGTLRNQLKSIYCKLEVSTREAAVISADRHGVLDR